MASSSCTHVLFVLVHRGRAVSKGILVSARGMKPRPASKRAARNHAKGIDLWATIRYYGSLLPGRLRKITIAPKYLVVDC
jgi:hypothetical protein